MTPKPRDPSPPTRPLDALGTALEQSHDVKAQAEAVAGELQQVTRNLAHDVGEVKAVEQALIGRARRWP